MNMPAMHLLLVSDHPVAGIIPASSHPADPDDVSEG